MLFNALAWHWSMARSAEPLLACAQNGQNKVAKMCVRYGADVNAQNVRFPVALRHLCPERLIVAASNAQARGNTALHFAVAYGFAALADWLRRSGAQPALRNAAGRPAIEGIGPEGDF